MLRSGRFKATDRVLLIICLMYLVTYIDRVDIGTAAPAMQKELGLSNVELGLAFSAFAESAVAESALAVSLGSDFTAVFCRNPCVVSRNRVRSTFRFFLAVGAW